MQAAELLEHLLAVRPGDLELAFDKLERRGLHKRIAKKIRLRLADNTALVEFVERRSKS
jgi:hypothetical protein